MSYPGKGYTIGVSGVEDIYYESFAYHTEAGKKSLVIDFFNSTWSRCITILSYPVPNTLE